MIPSDTGFSSRVISDNIEYNHFATCLKYLKRDLGDFLKIEEEW